MYDNKSDSGLLYIPEDSIRRANQGTVSVIGSEVTTVKVGDFVLFSGYSGTTVRVDGEIVIIMHEDFLTCKIDEEIGEVNGLYMRMLEGEHIPAPHNFVIKMLNLAVQDRDVDIPKPKKEEYNAPD